MATGTGAYHKDIGRDQMSRDSGAMACLMYQRRRENILLLANGV